MSEQTQMIPNATWTESSARPGVFLHQASGHNANVEWRPDGIWVVDTDADWSVRMNSGGYSGPLEVPADGHVRLDTP